MWWYILYVLATFLNHEDVKLVNIYPEEHLIGPYSQRKDKFKQH